MYPKMYGRRVRDCHAEVLARRGFRRQLYAEMVEPAPGGGGGILERILDNKFRLAADVTLHMYAKEGNHRTCNSCHTLSLSLSLWIAESVQ